MLRISYVSTGRLVIRLCAALVVLAVAASLVAGWAFRSVSHTAQAVRTQTAQATLELTSARSALIGADRAAITTFHSGGAGLTGPGEDYQNQIAAAAQSLARFAQLNGSRDALSLQVIEGMLATYSGSIGRADAYNQQAGGDFLARNELWNASQLVHMPGGILDQLRTLQEHQDAAANAQVRSGWMDRWTIPVWALLLAGLLALLICTQVFCYRRFRRRINPCLIAATALTAGLIAIMSVSAVSAHRLRTADTALDGVIRAREAQMAGADVDGQYQLAQLLQDSCRRSCGYTVEQFAAAQQQRPAAPDPTAQLSRRTRAVNVRFESAAETYGLGVVIAVIGIGIVALVLTGMYPRISEYRFPR